MSEKKVEDYLQKHPNWEEELKQLRAILKKSPLDETVKWGAPTYTYKNSNIVAMGAFKQHIGLWFFQGVFLDDPHGLLQNAQEGKTKAMRQIRFEKGDQIEESILLSYITEAIENEKAGKKMSPNRDVTYELPADLTQRFKENSTLEKAFYALSPGKQKEYANYIIEAKREATKLSRLSKIIPMIEDGKGLYDKYKNC